MQTNRCCGWLALTSSKFRFFPRAVGLQAQW
jgi:hypothetical protein